MNAWNDNDISKLREAFDEDAWMFYIDAQGICHKNLISKYFEAWAAPPGRGVVGRFISVTQVGNAASVQLSFDFASDKSSGFIDFHSLLRINGVKKTQTKPPPIAADNRPHYVDSLGAFFLNYASSNACRRRVANKSTGGNRFIPTPDGGDSLFYSRTTWMPGLRPA